MPDDRLYEIADHSGEDDYLSDDGLAKIGGELISKLTEFELGHTQGSMSSVTATIKFPVAGPVAQLEALDIELSAACWTRCLYANLVAARAELARLKATVDA
jgi:hypothetical protein